MRIFNAVLLIFTVCPVFTQQLYFPPVMGNQWEITMPYELHWCPDNIDSLYNFLENKNSKAFILLYNGRVVLEKYFNGFEQNDTWYWASAGKTLTAFMVGLAQQEGYLNISDTTSKYLGKGWTNCTPQQEEKITIRHQLAMTTGLDDGVADHYCTLDTCLVYKADAGARWAYHNGPYTLLDSVIQNATGFSLNGYMNNKLKTLTGISGLFFPSGYNNVYFSNARSMARFGLLMLNRGTWADTAILTDTAYFKQMVTQSQTLNKSYGYLWWLNGQESYRIPQLQYEFNGPLNIDAPYDMIAALGKNGQLINIVPGLNMVWVRMGEAPDEG